MTISYEEVFNLARQLPKEDQQRLTRELYTKQVEAMEQRESSPTIEELDQEWAKLHAQGAFENTKSLFGIGEATDDTVSELLREIRTEWEKELDE